MGKKSALVNGNLVRPKLSSLQVDQAMYYLAFGLYVLDLSLGRTAFERVLFIELDDFQNLLEIVMLILLLIKVVVFQHASIKQWIVAVVLVLLGFATWRVSGTGWLFWTALFIVCGQGIEVKKLAAVSFCVLVPLFLLTVTCAQLDIIDSVYLNRSGKVGTRSSMGFEHPNSFGLILFEICLALCVMRFGKRPVGEFVLIGVSVALCMEIADSRTAVLGLVVLALAVVIFYASHSGKMHTVINAMMFIGVVFVVFFSLYAMVVYTSSNTLLSQLNSLLSGRLYLANFYFERYSLSLLGRNYADAETVYIGGEETLFLIDNAYCNVILSLGVIVFVVLMTGIVLFYVNAVRSRRWDACLMGITMFLLYGFSEKSGLVFGDNYFLIGLVAVIYGEMSILGQGGKSLDRRRTSRTFDSQRRAVTLLDNFIPNERAELLNSISTERVVTVKLVRRMESGVNVLRSLGAARFSRYVCSSIRTNRSFGC